MLRLRSRAGSAIHTPVQGMASLNPDPTPDPRDGPLPIPRKRGRPKRRKATATDLVGAKHVRHLQGYLDHLHKAYDHPNRGLHYDTFLVAHVLAFFSPTLRSKCGAIQISLERV